MTEREIILAKRKYNEIIEDGEIEKDFYSKCGTNSKFGASYQAFNEIARKTEKSNEVLVCMGGYYFDYSIGIARFAEANNYTFVIYKDLETGTLYKVDREDKLAFTIEHRVVHLKVENPSIESYKKAYEDLRACFFAELVDNSQKHAVKKIVKRSI